MLTRLTLHYIHPGGGRGGEGGEGGGNSERVTSPTISMLSDDEPAESEISRDCAPAFIESQSGIFDNDVADPVLKIGHGSAGSDRLYLTDREMRLGQVNSIPRQHTRHLNTEATRVLMAHVKYSNRFANFG